MSFNGKSLRTAVSIGLLLVSLHSSSRSEVTLAPAWTRSFEGPSGYTDRASAMKVDASGNVVIAGHSRDSGPHQSHFMTIKVDSDGGLLWMRLEDGSGSEDDASDIGIDSLGQIYVTGAWAGGSANPDFMTIRYNPLGDTVWSERYDDTANGDDRAAALAVGADGSIYVAGTSSTATATSDFLTIKYDALGVPQWERRLAHPDTLVDVVYDALVDAQGNLVVVGECNRVNSWGDCRTVKYDSSGALQWNQVYGRSYAQDIPRAVAADRLGNVYVAIRTNDVFFYSKWDITLIRYNSFGSKVWERTYDFARNYDVPSSLVVDANGDIYAAGRSQDSSGAYDYVVLKYSVGGVLLWSRRYNGPANGDDACNALALAPSGGVIATGYSQGTSSGRDCLTLRYDPQGNVAWESRYNSPGNNHEAGMAIAADGLGHIYVTGEISSIGGDSADVLLLKYSPLCAQQAIGDVNASGQAALSDIIYLIGYVLKGGSAPAPCLSAGDIDCDGSTSTDDIIALVNYLLKAGTPPCDACSSPLADNCSP